MTCALSPQERIDILLEEYRSLNALLLFRLSALDRRLPASAGFTAAVVAATLSLPQDSQIAVLVLTPFAVLWMARTTVQHAIAKEDHLRRIEQIELVVNDLAETDLLAFQSEHPNRAKIAAGRSGSATVLTTSVGSVLMLVLCVILFGTQTTPVPYRLYLVYLALVGLDVVLGPIRLSRYNYHRRLKLITSRVLTPRSHS